MNTEVIKIAQVDESGGLGLVDRLGDIWGNLPEDQRSTVLRSLIGAGVGGTALGVSRSLSRRDKKPGDRGTGRQALLGALLGAGAGAASSFAQNPPGGSDKSDPEGWLGWAAKRTPRFAGAAASGVSYHGLVGRKSQNYRDRVLQRLEKLTRDKTIGSRQADSIRNAIKSYDTTTGINSSTVRGLRDRILHRSEPLARATDSPKLRGVRDAGRWAAGTRAGRAVGDAGRAAADATGTTSLLKKLRGKVRGLDPVNIKNYKGRPLSPAMSNTALTQLRRRVGANPHFSNIKPRALGRTGNAAGYLASMVGGHELQRAVTNRIMGA